MSNDFPRKGTKGRRPVWLTILLVVAILGIAWWQNEHQFRQVESVPQAGNSNQKSGEIPSGHDDHSTNRPDEDEPTIAEVAPDHEPISKPVGQTSSPAVTKKSSSPDQRRNSHSPPAEESHRLSDRERAASYLIENQVIRDLDGKVVYRGSIDLKPTLDRIESGQSNRHRNDGTTFQNREGRLPRKSAGYYKEYVNPTKGLSGPGPQRIILGQKGDVWYSPDHYKTFTQVKVAHD